MKIQWSWPVAVVGASAAYLTYAVTRKPPPLQPSSTISGTTLTLISDRPVPVITGTTYYGRGDVGWPVSMLVSASAITSKLQSMGFSNVAAYTSTSDLPADWPSDQRTGNVFASATYTGAPTTIALPSQVAAVWTYS
jgi:hypothetical protein